MTTAVGAIRCLTWSRSHRRHPRTSTFRRYGTEGVLQGWTIEVDLELCIGSGDCVGWAPEAFLLGSNDSTVRILPTAASASGDALKDAALSCPTGAIRLVSASGATFP